MQHYKDTQAHRPYSLTDPGGSSPPAPPPQDKADFDTNEYPPGTQLPTPPGTVTTGVTMLPTEQLLAFPPPRFASPNPLRPNFNWMVRTVLTPLSNFKLD